MNEELQQLTNEQISQVIEFMLKLLAEQTTNHIED